MYYCYEHLKLVDIFESVIYLSLQYPCLFNSESSSHEHGCSMTHAPCDNCSVVKTYTNQILSTCTTPGPNNVLKS